MGIQTAQAPLPVAAHMAAACDADGGGVRHQDSLDTMGEQMARAHDAPVGPGVGAVMTTTTDVKVNDGSSRPVSTNPSAVPLSDAAAKVDGRGALAPASADKSSSTPPDDRKPDDAALSEPTTTKLSQALSPIAPLAEDGRQCEQHPFAAHSPQTLAPSNDIQPPAPPTTHPAQASHPETLGTSKQNTEDPCLSTSSPLSNPATVPDGESLTDDHSRAVHSSPIDQPSTPGSPLSDIGPEDGHIEYDYDGAPHHEILRLKPTASQWDDFPMVLAFARKLGAVRDGCFKVKLPNHLQASLPEKPAQRVPANAYKVKQLKKTSFWQVSTVPSEGVFSSSESGIEFSDSVDVAFKNLKKLFNQNRNRQMRSVRYRVDVPAWTAKQRREAGVPERSPLHPLKGDKLEYTKAIIPGIHTPYVYESGPHFGATFQIHAEDFRLASLNHLYKGRKIWIVIPATAVDIAEQALGRGDKCSQFMRHRAEFFFPEKLEKLGIPYRIVDQRPGETIVILPDAYHEGFSTGYTLAEAKNYADADWGIDTYQPCQLKCKLMTAIPAELMRPVAEGETRLDLCAAYNAEVPVPQVEVQQQEGEASLLPTSSPLSAALSSPLSSPASKRIIDDAETNMGERDMKRVKI